MHYLIGALVGGFLGWFFTAWVYRVALIRLAFKMSAKPLIVKDLDESLTRA